VLTPDTLRRAEGVAEVKRVGAMPVKGMAEQWRSTSLTGGGPARTRFRAAAARGLTRFIGRDGEVDQLRHALERAAAGHGQVVANRTCGASESAASLIVACLGVGQSAEG
jgi:hypothetical protein